MSGPVFHTSSDAKEKAAEYIADKIKRHLDLEEKVLFLIPGGSAVVVLSDIGRKLRDIDCTNVSITLTDERYGEDGHADSNWSQIVNNVIKNGPLMNGSIIYPVLQGKDENETASDFNKTLQYLVEKSDYIIGLFGIGRDGHTSGILPGSRAVDSTDFVYGYQCDDYYRITTTPVFLSHLDEAIVYATGASKRETLEKLKSEHPMIEQPAQALKQADTFIIFND